MSDLSSSSAPARRPGTSVRELTFRGIVLGGLMTLIFTAANVYLGLKVGLTSVSYTHLTLPTILLV